MTKLVENKYSNDVRLQFSDYLPNNVEKGRPLEIATKIALQSLSIPFEDLTHVYNGAQMSRHKGLICGFVPDFRTSEYVIECKEWNDTYRVSLIMANTKIIQRVGRYRNKKPIVVFGKVPRFQKGVKAYLLRRVKLFCVGFSVKWHNLKRAVQVLKKSLFNILNSSLSHIYNSNSCKIVGQNMFCKSETLRDDTLVFPQKVLHHFSADSGPPLIICPNKIQNSAPKPLLFRINVLRLTSFVNLNFFHLSNRSKLK